MFLKTRQGFLTLVKKLTIVWRHEWKQLTYYNYINLIPGYNTRLSVSLLFFFELIATDWVTYGWEIYIIILLNVQSKINLHQWYWSYEYSDFVNDDGESIEFDSYMIPGEDLEDGQLRQLEVDSRVIVPVNTHIRFIVTGADVIHDFAVPALGLKIDATPGRLNQASVLIQREGVFYGQCSEICGVLHSAMPIAIEAVSVEKYLAWLDSQA